MKTHRLFLLTIFILSLRLNAAGIAGYEYWYDHAFTSRIWVSVTGTPAEYTLAQQFDASGLTPGLHFFHVRFKDDAGRWSAVRSTSFYIMPPAAWGNTANTLTSYEYWIDHQFNVKTAGAIQGVPTFTLNTQYDYATLNPGLHYFHIRFRDGEGHWSAVRSTSFYIAGAAEWSNLANVLTAYEYWIDHRFEQRVTGTIENAASFVLNSPIDFSTLHPGLHYFHFRAGDAQQRWSAVRSTMFYIPGEIPSFANNLIDQYRYWFDNNTAGTTTVTLPAPANPYTLNTAIDAPVFDAGSTHAFHIQFRDIHGNWSTALATTFTVPSNNPPVAACRNVTVAVSGGTCTADASIDDGSYDPDQDAITIVQTPPGPYPIGTTQVTLTVTDANDVAASCMAAVTVEDRTPPVITPNPTAIHIWSPNHQYETFTLSQMITAVTDNCGSIVGLSITHVTSDEPEDAPGNGDGSTLNDIVIAANCQSVQLRSERCGTLNGRVYTIYFEAEDSYGNRSTASFHVNVQHDANTPAIEDQVAYTVTGCGIPKEAVEDIRIPDGYALYQNYPNPFGTASMSGTALTSISYALPSSMSVLLRVYDSFGREVATLVNDEKTSGRHSVTFDAHDLPSGIYLIKLEAGATVLTRLMSLVK